MLDEKHTITDVVKILCDEFPSVSEKRVRKGLDIFLDELKVRKLIST